MHINWSTVLPVITLVLGWALASVTEWWKGKRDSAAKVVERREARIVKRNEFQRESLLALQEAAVALSSAAKDAMRVRILTDPEEQHTLDRSALDAYREYLKMNTKVEMLTHRVRDREVRTTCSSFQSTCLLLTSLFNSVREASDAANDVARRQIVLNRTVEKALDDIDALDDQVG